MALSQDLINQFVKLTEQEEKKQEVTVNGTYKTINGEEFVQLDGSDIWTPVNSMVEAETGERVKVLIKNHTATVTGNISSPSARSKSVQDLKDEVDEQGNTIKQLDNSIEQQGNSIIQIENNIKQVNNDILQANNAINQQNNTIKQFGNTIDQQNNIINQQNNIIKQNSNEIDQMNNTIVQHNNTIIQHGNQITQQNNIIEQQGNEIKQYGNDIHQLDNRIDQQGNDIHQLDNRIDQQGNDITQIDNKVFQQGNIINQQGNLIDQHGNIIVEHGNKITILNSGFQIIDGVLTGLSAAIIDELITNHLDAEYAEIDFANINIAAVEKLFTESGIIKDLIVKEGKITGELVGVTIKGDLIEGNTIKADKLVVKGEDGVYYKLNLDGLNNISTSEAAKFVLTTEEPENWETNYTDYYIISSNKYVHVTGEEAPTWQANTYYKLNSSYESGLDGTVIVAHSITADRIAVTDLVAFGATIGGFEITDHSIHSTGKTSATSSARGIYMDDSGQLSFGDANNFVKFFKDTDNQYKLMIMANEIYSGSSSESIAEQIQAAMDAAEDAQESADNVQTNLTNFTDVTFTEYKRDQEATDRGLNTRLTSTEITVYGDPEDPSDPNALVNKIQEVDSNANEALDRIGTAEETLEDSGLNDFDTSVKITQRFLNVETDVEQIKNIFKITGGTNLVQNSVGYFADNDNKPTLWSISSGTIYTPFGYDADLVGATVSRGRLFCAKGSIVTTPNNIVALLANRMMSVTFKYKNGANATSKIKVFNGSVTFFEKTFSSAVNQWTEYTFNPDTDPVLANNSFICTANALQISIESSNSNPDNNNGFEISDLMLNYGDGKPWELSNNEVYGAMVKLSSLGIEVTASAAHTKNFITTDGILVYKYDPVTDTIIGDEAITKITDNGTLTNHLESTGDIIERDLINTMIKDSSNNNVYVEYIK